MKHVLAIVVFCVATSTSACSFFDPSRLHRPEPRAEVMSASLRGEAEPRGRGEAEPRRELVRPPVPAAPAPPADAAGRRTYEAAKRASGARILISLQDRHLWLIEGSDTVFVAPIAIGTGAEFRFRSQRWVFDTPQGVRRVIDKEEDPLWVPPNWHYYEIAVERELEPVYLRNDSRVALKDGTHIEVRNGEVGRVNHLGNWWPFTPGREMIFDGKIFVPPLGSPQRRIPLTLGTRKLDLGDGYLIHGTDQPTSIGTAASHGCIRMYNEDVEHLYELVAIGTRVFIY